MPRLALAVVLLGASGLFGCAGKVGRVENAALPTTGPATRLAPSLSPPTYNEPLQATVRPPEGWVPKVQDAGATDHTHIVWLSPSGHTAYGIISFNLPLPVGPQFVLGAFLSEMKKREGKADLISKTYDETLKGIRFEAVGGRYHTYTNLMTRGWHGWFVYAGTGTADPENLDELALAKAARENTLLGEPAKTPEPEVIFGPAD